jgi:hypothetical protein
MRAVPSEIGPRVAQERRPKPPLRVACSVAVLALALGLGAVTPAFAAERERAVSVTGPRIALREVLPECPERACDADLGPAPPAGSSRLLAAQAIRSAIQAAGEDASRFASLSSVRVSSAARALSRTELAELVRPAIEAELPASARLIGVEAKSALVIPLLATLGNCTLAALPKRAGAVTSTALVDFLHEGTLVRRVPILVRLMMSERAALADVPRGHVLSLVISRRGASVSTNGVALKPADIGQVGVFRVQRTGRVVQARIESASVALVVEGS